MRSLFVPTICASVVYVLVYRPICKGCCPWLNSTVLMAEKILNSSCLWCKMYNGGVASGGKCTYHEMWGGWHPRWKWTSLPPHNSWLSSYNSSICTNSCPKPLSPAANSCTCITLSDDAAILLFCTLFPHQAQNFLDVSRPVMQFPSLHGTIAVACFCNQPLSALAAFLVSYSDHTQRPRSLLLFRWTCLSYCWSSSLLRWRALPCPALPRRSTTIEAYCLISKCKTRLYLTSHVHWRSPWNQVTVILSNNSPAQSTLPHWA